MEHKHREMFANPLVWVGALAMAILGGLVGSIVLGQFQSPTGAPGSTGGAIRLDSEGDLILSPSGDEIEVPGTRRVVAGTDPTGPSHLANKGYVDSQVGQYAGGGTLITLWGTCRASDVGVGPGGCIAGSGAPSCVALGPEGTVKEVYVGYGPFVYAADDVGVAPNEYYRTVDSIVTCNNSSHFVTATGPTPVSAYYYRAAWNTDSTPEYEFANTCRVCLLGGGYQPTGGTVGGPLNP